MKNVKYVSRIILYLNKELEDYYYLLAELMFEDLQWWWFLIPLTCWYNSIYHNTIRIILMSEFFLWIFFWYSCRVPRGEDGEIP